LIISRIDYFKKSFGKKRIFTSGDKRKKTIAFLLKDRSRYCGKTCLF